MAIGVGGDARRAVLMRAPRLGPQSFTRNLLRADVLGATIGSPRAPIVAVVPKRSRTYFGAYRPGTAQRIPPVINTGYGGLAFTDSERLRRTLVARARFFRASLNQPAGGVTPPSSSPPRTSRLRDALGLGRTTGVTG